METKHTPGPWDAVEGFGEYQARVISRTTQGTVAPCHSVQDAFLIAAAPDLLAALREALNQLETNYQQAMSKGHHWPNERVNMTSAAKLKGQQAIARAS